jgi:uncharacterized membrane protein (DUF4010 family)
MAGCSLAAQAGPVCRPVPASRPFATWTGNTHCGLDVFIGAEAVYFSHSFRTLPMQAYNATIMLSAQADLFYRFGVALVVGFLIGLEREHAAEDRKRAIFAGVRTFSLLSLAGCTAALLSELSGSPWLLVAAFISIGSLIVAGYINLSRSGQFGGTSEVAAFIALFCGMLAYWNYIALTAAIAVATTVLLSLKPAMRNFAQRLSNQDVYATLKFAVITAIVLPILPNRTFGPPPLDALNPYNIWLMVVFISGISFTGYVLMQVVNPRRGIPLTGLLGGLVSSTAVTLSLSARSRQQPELTTTITLAITLAWITMFLRVLVAVAAINVPLLLTIWLPLLAGAAAPAVYALVLYLQRMETNQQDVVTLVNPFELGPALTFGGFYALILLVARSAQLYFGDTGILVSGALAGLTDVNAITLTMAELSGRTGGLPIQTAANAIILAVLANTLTKSVLVFVAGGPAIRKAILPTAALSLLVLGTFVVLWR